MIFTSTSQRRRGPIDSESGVIVLYNQLDVKLASMSYSHGYNRVKIMKQWIEVYGEEKMKTFYVHLIPTVKL